MIAERGTPGLLKALREGAKEVTDHNNLGVNRNVNIPETSTQGGAFYSMRGSYTGDRTVKESQTSGYKTPIKENKSFNVSLLSRLYESVQTVHETKEYYNAVSSLLTLYAIGKLDESAFDNMTREDIREIKGIIRDFKSTIDMY